MPVKCKKGTALSPKSSKCVKRCPNGVKRTYVKKVGFTCGEASKKKRPVNAYAKFTKKIWKDPELSAKLKEMRSKPNGFANVSKYIKNEYAKEKKKA